MRNAIPIRRILVTACCVFIGANLVRHELATVPAIEITNLDALMYAGNPDSLADPDDEPRCRFVRGDVADRAMVMRLVADGGFDAVVNFAAESHVARSLDDATPFFRTNVVGTQCLLGNFGGRYERFNIDVTPALLNLFGKDEKLIRHVADRPGRDRRYAVDCSKSEGALGRRPTVPFEEGLASTVAWYGPNADWVDRIHSAAYLEARRGS